MSDTEQLEVQLDEYKSTLVIDGFINGIQKMLNHQIIPLDINPICFKFYFVAILDIIMEPLTIENHAQQWRYFRVKQIKCSFNKVYYEARVVSAILAPYNLTTIQIGWALPLDDDTAIGDEKLEYVVLGNRYYMERIGAVLIHKRPFQICHNNEICAGFGEKNDKIVCTADFERKEIAFYINETLVVIMEFPLSFIESDKPLIPVIGLSSASVELNFKMLESPINHLISDSFLSIQECLQYDRGDWFWERGDWIDWNLLYIYGLCEDFNNKTQEELANNEAILSKFRDIVLDIFHFLTYNDLLRCREVCRLWHEIINRRYYIHRSKLKCYYTDKSFEAEGISIGLMLNLKIDNNKTQRVEIMSCSKDFISYNIWNKLNIHIDSIHEEFTHFLPIIINEENGERVSKILTKSITKIMKEPGFNVEYALFILSSLLNSVIKTLHRELFIKKRSASMESIISKNLTVWCHLHHILLQLYVYFPAMQTAADSKIKELFIDNSNNNIWYNVNDLKTKLSTIADLGILIMYLLISNKYRWHTIRRLWVEEIFSRDCKKLCSDYRNIELKNKLDCFDLLDKERLDIMYQYTKQSRSLTRLLIAFITLQHEYDANDEPKKVSIKEQLRLYNLRFGSPHPQWIIEIEDKLNEIRSASSWSDYFTGIFVITPQIKVISNLLFRCFKCGAQR